MVLLLTAPDKDTQNGQKLYQDHAMFIGDCQDPYMSAPETARAQMDTREGECTTVYTEY